VESPDQDQRAAAAIDASIGKRHFMAEIEQAFMNPPFGGLRRHGCHVANFRRQPKIEPAPLYITPPPRDQHHARTQANTQRDRAAEAKRDLDVPVGQPRKAKLNRRSDRARAASAARI